MLALCVLLLAATALPILLAAGSAQEDQADGSPANALAAEKSPYLLQHAHNPVQWVAWSDEAFERAKAEEKPVFVSIGYSTCHWCHVMAHESFEDEEVAQLLNQDFVCVKVDREERPDIDAIYMDVCQMLSGRGGWPLTIVTTPDRRPFFAATYIPKETRPPYRGLLELLPEIAQTWRQRRNEILDSAAEITRALSAVRTRSQSGRLPNEDVLEGGYRELAHSFDRTWGGFGSAPKFPTPHALTFLLRFHRRTGEKHALQMVELTLQNMRRGGIFDHLGYGYHRYSTDRPWRTPHFEKMLYDQAQMALACVETWRLTGEGAYREMAEETFEYVLRDLTSPEGGFYSAEDADSEGEEGLFYLWTQEEIRDTLPPDLASFAEAVFDIEELGNYRDEASGRRTGRNILHYPRSREELQEDLDLDDPAFRARVIEVRQRLLAARNERPRPHRDEKILADWNGLMIGALARGGRLLDRQKYVQAATRAGEFAISRLHDADGLLLHRYCDGEAAVDGFLDDYACLAWGFTELYAATFDPLWLERALVLVDLLHERFADPEGGAYYMAAATDGPLPRPRRLEDGAVPGGNSMALLVTLRLARLTGRADLQERADALQKAYGGWLRDHPAALTQFLVGVDEALGRGTEVVLVGPRESDEMQRMLDVLHRHDDPHWVVLLKDTAQRQSPLDRLAPFTRDMTSGQGQVAAYICREYACQAPVTSAAALEAVLADSPQS